MAPKKTLKGKSGFFGVRQKPSATGVWSSPTPKGVGGSARTPLPKRPRVPTTWRCGVPRGLGHTSTFQRSSRAVAEMLVPQGINMKEITTKKKIMKKPLVVVSAGETDEEAMARFAREHPEYVQAELEYYWKREAEQKKKGPKKEDEAGPSTVMPIESSSEEDWVDFSEEEEEGCDDPTKEEFWEQFRSSDEE
ncbi:hypothetical protein CFC21_076210 [Triticum aestivum]|uniref:Uncharacterized protein n=2 Tax=Triticum aestivum TaxID=4565 RepID=A0A9R1HRK6_WHEAT|nr:hypothetical protein CFC21_076210 [Triticum aestivum]